MKVGVGTGVIVTGNGVDVGGEDVVVGSGVEDRVHEDSIKAKISTQGIKK